MSQRVTQAELAAAVIDDLDDATPGAVERATAEFPARSVASAAAAAAAGGGNGGSQPGPMVFTIYGNKWATIDPTQNDPGFGVAAGGTFKLSYNGAETAPIDWDASAADVLAALNAIPALTGKIALDTDDHAGTGANAGPLPTAAVGFVLDDSLAPFHPIVLSDNSLVDEEEAAIDDWPIGVPSGYTVVLPDAFTPEEDDVIEDWWRAIIEPNDGLTSEGPQELFLFDGTLDDAVNGSVPDDYWQAPRAGVHLNEEPGDFTNFYGKFQGAAGPSAVTVDTLEGSEVALPVTVKNPVPLSWYWRVQSGAPHPNGVFRVYVRVTTPTEP